MPAVCRCTSVSVGMSVCVCVCVSVLLHYILGFSTSCTLNNSEGRFACCPRYVRPWAHCHWHTPLPPPCPLPPFLAFMFAPLPRPFATHLIVRFVLTAAQLRSCALLNFLSEFSFFSFFSIFNFLFRFACFFFCFM